VALEPLYIYKKGIKNRKEKGGKGVVIEIRGR